MNWDEKAGDYAVAHHTYDHLDYGTNAKICMGFELGAHWQRDQLRTDEAIEKVAVWLFTRSWKPAIDDDKGVAWWDRMDDESREPWRTEARAAITALLGEGSD